MARTDKAITAPKGVLTPSGAGKLYPFGGWSILLYCAGLVLIVISVAAPHADFAKSWKFLLLGLILVAVNPGLGCTLFAQRTVRIGADAVIVHRPPTEDRRVPFMGINHVTRHIPLFGFSEIITVYYDDPAGTVLKVPPAGLSNAQRTEVYDALVAHASAQPPNKPDRTKA
ncbi:MAG: hypothetical protein LBM66_04370 [Bifidobacteriaceae bacterium]|jgi:hypothetical protein|nr:hypothetical protein [Bifidobacteriaceae bacterium]